MKRVHAALIAAAASVAAFASALESFPGPAEVPPQTAESVNEFAFDFYRNLSETEGNVFFSPVGTHTVFSIVYEGAGGSTSSRMVDLFGFEPDDKERRAASANMMAAINAEDPRAVLEMANALWMSDWFESYLDVVRQAYLVEAETYPIEAEEFYFGEPRPVWGEIDYWASEKAGGKIAPRSIAVVQCGPLLAIVANVVNFEGSWTIQFPKEDTRTGQFWRGEGDGVYAHFMHAKGGFDYANAEDAQVLRLPYEGDRLSMLVVLPYEAGGLERLAERSGARMGEWLGMLESRNISVSLPKFQIATYHGVHLDAGARTEDAKFRVSTHPGVWSYIVEHKIDEGSVFPHLNGFNEGGCYLDGVGHRAYLTVNENGTETSEDAAAMSITESEPPPPLHFNANRPFLFAIYDEQSGLILFMGRVSDPAGSPAYRMPPDAADNDGPEIAVFSDGAAVTGNVLIAAGQRTSLDVRVSDPDGDAVTITAIPDTLPGSAISSADGGDGAATVMLDAASVPAGTYVFWISASDGKESEREPFVVVVQ